MFGRQGGLAGNSSGTSGHLIEFRAGRMNMIGKMVHPDARKGLVYLNQSEDGLMHFCWKDRTTGKVEADLIVFPDDFEFKRVEQCKTGRVYVLKFKSSTRRMFFWMQEPKIDKDEEYCRRVNELMNNPPSAQRSTADGGDLQYMLNNMSQQQLMQLFGGVGQMGGLSSLLGSMGRQTEHSRTSSSRNAGAGLLTSDPSVASTRSSSNKEKTSKSSSSGTPVASTTATVGGDEAGRSLNVDLATAITNPEAIDQVLSDPDRTKQLSVHLPDNEDSDESKKQQIKDTIASPQFQQALSLFSNALQSAQLGPVVSQFELTSDAVAAAYSGNLEEFVKALEKSLPAGTSMKSPAAVKDAEDVTKMEESAETEASSEDPAKQKE